MKFAKELERDLVPEWRVKYLDYKGGKKKLKAIKRALRTVNQTPRHRFYRYNAFTPSPYEAAPKYAFLNRNHGQRAANLERDPGELRSLSAGIGQPSGSAQPNGATPLLPLHVPSNEEAPLNAQEDPRRPGLTRYGSIIGTPPKDEDFGGKAPAPPSLKLPGAALDPENVSSRSIPPSDASTSKSKPAALPPAEHVGNASRDAETLDAFKVGKTRSPTHSKSLPARYRSIFSPKRINSTPGTPVTQQPRPLLDRVFSLGPKEPPPSTGDVPLEAYREFDLRQTEFFLFLDKEFEKIETFYKQKEDEATARLAVLREQLHIMRDRRLDDLIRRQAAKMKTKAQKHAKHKPLANGQLSSDEDGSNGNDKENSANASLLNPLDSALQAVEAGKYGKSTKAMHDLATPSGLDPRWLDQQRDYVRRRETDVSFDTARKKLKVAMQEYYRSLELLKSYALLNRTAFRKINKKYDKTVNARPALRYMAEKVNKAWFVNSDVIEGHIQATEDLYARYFEKGNRKVAVGKLRIKMARPGDYTETSFRNGVMLGVGALLGIQGIAKACQLLQYGDATMVTNTSYLLQIYAGYFLMNFLFLLFCLDCRVWLESKINYVFVFEYDTRHHLDWRQLSELPSFFLLLLGLFMFLNFNQYGAASMFIYYPVVLLGFATIFLFIPFKVIYHRSRLWLIHSMWRLVFPGIYPVEWRDFYMGDMFCSLTYSMGNIELFFCLYANRWGNPVQCNSSHSRLLGFFSTLPGIWRAIQCYRRYHDSGNAFPHVLNMGKYMATIVFYMTLSIYRIDETTAHRALFITFAIINSIYTSFWDVYYDWSLGDPNAKHPFLRQTLGYKKVWMYYVAMVIDPILRFNWIFYVVLPQQLQHSAVTSFCVAFSEVCRRGMWSLFRVENEHCSNVNAFHAYRDIPLPYDIPSAHGVGGQATDARGARVDEEQPTPHADEIAMAPAPSHASGADLDRTRSSTRRRRPSLAADAQHLPSPMARGLQRMSTALRTAHAQDFVKKKRPELGETGSKDDDSDDDDDDDDDGEEQSRQASYSTSHSAQDGRQSRRDIERAREEVEIGRAGLE